MSRSTANPKPKASTRPLPRPRRAATGLQRDDAATRRTILDAALFSFSIHGFEGTSIANIAKTHNVSPPLVHYYFNNKDELWRATIEHALGNTLRDFREVIEDLSDFGSIPRLKFFVKRFVGIIAERPEAFQIIIRESETPGPRLTWLAEHYLTSLYGMVTKLIEDAQADGSIKLVAAPFHLAQIIAGTCYHFLGSRNRMLETYHVDVLSKEMRDKHAQAVIEILFRGMLNTSDCNGAPCPQEQAEASESAPSRS